MNKAILISGAALLAAAGAGIALAQGGPEGPGRGGDVTRQQVIARVDAIFARLDANHDGRITPDEMHAMGAHRREEMRGRMFDRLDANHDGMISREEFDRAHALAGGPEGPRGMEMGPPPPGGPDGPRGHGMRMMFAGDGPVTLEQMRARALERFDRADANHDGILTADERRAARERRRERADEPRPN